MSGGLSVPEQRVQQFLTDLLNLEAIEVGFNCFLNHRPDLEKANQVSCCNCYYCIIVGVNSIVDVCQDNAREEFISILTSLSVTNHVEERVSSGGCNCNRCTAVR